MTTRFPYGERRKMKSMGRGEKNKKDGGLVRKRAETPLAACGSAMDMQKVSRG